VVRLHWLNKEYWKYSQLQIPIFWLLILSGNFTYAQINRDFYNNYFSQYTINPAAISMHGYSQFGVNFQKQLEGVVGSPQYGSIDFQHPFNKNISMATMLINEKAGILNTTSAVVTFGYRIYLGRADFDRVLGIGLSGGAFRTSIDTEQIDDPSDPAILNIQSNPYRPQSNFGLFYKSNRLTIGLSLLSLLSSEYDAQNNINYDFKPADKLLSYLRYRMDLSPDILLEPQLMYVKSNLYDNDIQLNSMLIIREFIGIGGGYGIESGLNFLFTLKIGNNTRISFATNLPNRDVAELNQAISELDLQLIFGNKVDFLNDDKQVEDKVVSGEKSESIPVESKVVEREEIVPEKTEDLAKIEEIIEVEEIVPVKEDYPIVYNVKSFEKGFYLIVGSYITKKYAEIYEKKLMDAGYSANILYHSELQKYYVIFGFSMDAEKIRNLRDQVRQKRDFQFANAWMLEY